jgi:hypothetical protein
MRYVATASGTETAILWIKTIVGVILILAGIVLVFREAPNVPPTLAGQSLATIVSNVVSNQPALPSGIVMIIIGALLLGLPAKDICTALGSCGGNGGGTGTPSPTP